MIGDIATPSVPNGLAYVATRFANSVNPVWTPDTVEVLNNQVEPTVPNGYFYIATSVDGDNPVTGATEPIWPVSTGATVTEISQTADDAAASTPTSAPQPSALSNPSTTTTNRYANPASPGGLYGPTAVGNPANPFTGTGG
jgi:hypothetical protein